MVTSAVAIFEMSDGTVYTYRGSCAPKGSTPRGNAIGEPSARAALFAGTHAGVFARDYPKGEVARQMFTIGNRSLLFICVTMGFLGMVMVMQSGQQIGRVTGDLTQLGPEFFFGAC